MTTPSTKLGGAYVLAAATVTKLKCELKPGELENTVNFVEQFLEYGLENDKTLQSSTKLLLKLGMTTDWMMDLPLWCLINTFESPRDAIFEKDVSELYTEVHKIMKTNKDITHVDTVGYCIDIILGYQLEKKIFKTVQDAINFFVMFQNLPLKNAQNWFKNGFSLTYFQELWLKTLLKDFLNQQKTFKNVEKLINGNFSKFLNVNLKFMNDFLLNCLESEESKQNFEEFLKDYFFAEISEKSWKEIFSQKIDSVVQIHAKLICEKIKQDLSFLNNKINGAEKIRELESSCLKLFGTKQWKLSQFDGFIRRIETVDDLENLIELFNTVHEMRIEYKNLDISKPTQDWTKNAILTTTQKIFSHVSKEFSFDELLNQIIQQASGKLDRTLYEKQYHECEDAYDYVSNNYHSFENIKFEIKNYRKTKQMTHAGFRESKWLDKEVNRIATALYAINTFFNIKMRPVQILAIIVALDSRKQKRGRLLQVQTGEGKTNIVAALAIIEAIGGTKVDIVTSSSELAVTQFDKMKPVYDSIGLKVSHNANNNASDELGGKTAKLHAFQRLKAINAGEKDPGKFTDNEEAVYKADIIYGAVEDYQADVLHCEFAGSKLRFDRKYELVIVDEVDSMFIDGRNDSVRLSSKTPGMNDILQIYTSIWSQIKNIHSQMKKENGKWYYLGNDEAQEFTGEYTMESFAKDCTLNYMRKLLRFDPLTAEEKTGQQNWDAEAAEGEHVIPEFPLLEIPDYLKNYSEIQLPKWIDSAVNAMFNMNIGFDYVLKDGKIVVVDAANTGVHHPSMRWSDGLHQFLQMKHGCYLESEALATNFISKATFFLRYKTSILGLTGTIGGESSRKFLSEVYNVDFVDIPPFKERLHYELAPHLCISDDQWLETIVLTVLSKLRSGRAVLIITNYIKYAEKMCAKLSVQWEKSKIKLYTDQEGTEHTKDPLNPGECVVATNIAGRGTDLLVTETVEKTGGLHVLLTFLPENDRVERQNIGRTSRTGNRGTSQIILNFFHLPLALIEKFQDNFDASTAEEYIESLKRTRDELSLKAAEKAVDDVNKTKGQDSAFRKFMEIRQRQMNKVVNDELKHATKNSMDIMFGTHLRLTKEVTEKTVEEAFSKIKNDTYVLSNPYDAIGAAKKFFENENYSDAEKFYKKALEIDDKFCAAAYYQLGHLAIEKYKKEKSAFHINDAINYFEKSKISLEMKKTHIEMMIQVIRPEFQSGKEVKDSAIECDDNTILKEQLTREIILISAVINNIDYLIGRKIDDDIEFLETKLKEDSETSAEKMSDDERNALKQQLNDMKKNKYDIENGVLRKLKTSLADIKIDKKDLKQTLPQSEDVNLYGKEIQRFGDDQFDYTIIVNEKAPINWWAIVAIGSAALLQIVGGASAAIFSFGMAASVGLAFLQEGVCDLIYAVKNGIFERNISWAAYGIRKAISLTITVISFGFGALKAAAQGAKEGMKAAGRAITGVARDFTQKGVDLATKLVLRTAAVEVAKVTVNQTIDYVCAGTMENSVGNVVKNCVNEALSQMLKNNENLKLLLACDKKEKNLRFANMFTKRVMGRLHQNHPLVEQIKQGAMDILNKSMEKAGYGVEMKVCSMFVKGFNAVATVSSITTHLEYIKTILEDIVAENDEKIKRILKKQETEQRDDLAYSKEVDYSANTFLNSLSEDISNVLCALVMGLTKQYIVSKTANVISNNLTSGLNEEIEQYRTDRQHTQNYINNVADTIPGDIIQAKYLSKYIKKPIKIITTDENGNEKVEMFGTEFSAEEEEPVELIYERPIDGGIGHYKLSDGTVVDPSGDMNCLYDAVGLKTGYNADDLRRGTANVMKNDFLDVAEDSQSKNFTDLCVGGANFERPSQARLKHVKKIEKGTDVQAANDRANNERHQINKTAKRPRPNPIPSDNEIFDMESSEFDNEGEYCLNEALAQNATQSNPVVHGNFKGYINSKGEFVLNVTGVRGIHIQQDATGHINNAEMCHVAETEFNGYQDPNGLWKLNHLDVKSIIEEQIKPAFPRQTIDPRSNNPLPPNPFRGTDDII